MMLTDDQKEFLDHNGYLIIPNVLSEQQVGGMRDRLDELELREGLSAGSARQTYWQRQLPPGAGPMARSLSAVYNMIFRLVMVCSKRWIFRFAPALKDRLQQLAGPVAASETLWQAMRSEFREMLHAAAIQEHGALRICDLVNKGAVFDPCFTDGRVLEAVGQVIAADVKLSSLNYRVAEPGGGLQPLHIDWFHARGTGQVPACNTLWMLDDLTPVNGATRVVPGSHLQALSPEDVVDDLHEPHSQETLILAKAGSVAIINGQVWHGGTKNQSLKRRRIIQSYFVGRNVSPQLDQQSFVTAETLARLDPTARTILNVS